MNMFSKFIVFALTFLTLVGCGGGGGDAPATTTEELELLEVVTLTDETETGIEARPEIFFYNDAFFIVYKYAPDTGFREHRVRIYDSGLSADPQEFTISSFTSDYGSPTDIRGKQVGNKVYLAYESITDSESHLLLTVHNLDESFSRTAPTEVGSVLITSSGGGLGDEVLFDPTVHIKDGSLILLTKIVLEGPEDGSIHYFRKLDASDLTIDQEGEIDLGAVDILGMGGVSALFDYNGTTTGIFRHMFDPEGPWELKRITLTDNFLPIAESVKTIAAQGRNFYPSGFLAWNNRYLLAHSNKDTYTTPAEGEKGEEQREIWLKWFSQDFELLQAIKLDDLGIHPTLATDGEKLYLAYSSGGILRVALFRVAQI